MGGGRVGEGTGTPRVFLWGGRVAAQLPVHPTGELVAAQLRSTKPGHPSPLVTPPTRHQADQKERVFLWGCDHGWGELVAALPLTPLVTRVSGCFRGVDEGSLG